MSMECADARPYLLDRVRGRAVDPAVLAHVAGCAACTQDEAGERALEDLLRAQLPRTTEVPARLDAAPKPKRKPSEKLNAPGGKSKARAALKCIAPVTITASVVSNVPIHKLTVIVPIEVMRR